MSRRKGYLDGRALAEVFAWLRPGDLVWNYWVNNYLLGKPPPAFDILFWNADTTRMTAGLHADFVDMAMDNQLADPGALSVLGEPIDLSRIDVDSYVVAGIADHITPWQNCYRTTQLLRRRQPVRAVHQRPHRGPGQPAGQPEGVVLHEQGRHPGRRGRVADAAPRRARAPGGPTSSPGWTSAAAPLKPAPTELGGPVCRPWPTHPAPTSSTTERQAHMFDTIGRARGTDYFRIADQLTAGGARLLEPHPALRRRRGAAGHQRLLGARRVPSRPGREAGQRSGSSATASRATAARR